MFSEHGKNIFDEFIRRPVYKFHTFLRNEMIFHDIKRCFVYHIYIIDNYI